MQTKSIIQSRMMSVCPPKLKISVTTQPIGTYKEYTGPVMVLGYFPCGWDTSNPQKTIPRKKKIIFKTKMKKNSRPPIFFYFFFINLKYEKSG